MAMKQDVTLWLLKAFHLHSYHSGSTVEHYTGHIRMNKYIHTYNSLLVRSSKSKNVVHTELLKPFRYKFRKLKNAHTTPVWSLISLFIDRIGFLCHELCYCMNVIVTIVLWTLPSKGYGKTTNSGTSLNFEDVSNVKWRIKFL